MRYNSHIFRTAIAFNIIAIMIALGYIMMMFWRLPSLCQLIQHGVHNNNARILLYITVFILVLLYICDVFTMMFYYWGAPAYIMTISPYLPVNEWRHRTCNETIPTNFLDFIYLMFEISLFTPIIWSIVICIGFLVMLCGEKKRN